MKLVIWGQVLMNKLGNNGIKTICILAIGGMADAFHLDVISMRQTGDQGINGIRFDDNIVRSRHNYSWGFDLFKIGCRIKILDRCTPPCNAFDANIACNRREKIMYISFDNRPDNMRSMRSSP